jgi:hypothetical protein
MSEPVANPPRRSLFAVWRWTWVVLLVLMPVTYLASYPAAYRILVGPDYVWQFGRIQDHKLELDATYGGNDWKWLEQNIYPLAEWALHKTPLRQPMLLVARVFDVEMQIEGRISAWNFREASKKSAFSEP